MHAAQGGHTEIVALLLDRGAEVDKSDLVSIKEIMSAANIFSLFF